MRLGVYSKELKKRLSAQGNIWIHAVSVGEVVLANVLVDRIKNQLPQYNVVVSTVTETGNAVARKIMGSKATLIYLPLDLTPILKRVIGIIKPIVFIVMETEIWPNLIRCLHNQDIPIFLSNGRISTSSHKQYMLLRPLFKRTLKQITQFLMRTQDDAEKIISLGAPAAKVSVVGNMKFDNVDFNIEAEKKEEFYKILNLGNKKLIVAGSTHSGEEEVLLTAYSKLKAKYTDILLLIAPRHTERSDEIIKIAQKHNLNSMKISELNLKNYKLDHEPIYILDTIGQLKLFYSLAWTVFVGGSLIKHGGQNMIEPAFFAKAIIFGPHTFNFKDIAQLFIKNKAAILVKDTASLEEAIKRLYLDEALTSSMGHRAKEITQANQGAATRTFSAIKTVLQ